ncbi:hypothetical protein [Candidatus Cardinium hertigii]|uniref:Leucine-rich repeat domain-containing protein n=1 Tax=Candidatus Cardinium hertigii TaxID=247481 RepID=A0A3N2QD40_9BACT|nr:hypothetical protein [Candidatus Cardinium hertigii]ROT47707.1 hypothetical protein EDM02_00850 [Candidatus Cardinium hertigii]
MKKQFILPKLFLLGSSFTACQVSKQAMDHAIEIRLPNELTDLSPELTEQIIKCMPGAYHLEKLQRRLPQNSKEAAFVRAELARRQHYYELYTSYVNQFSTLTELRDWPNGTDANHLRAAAEALAYNRSITKIYLGRRNMGSERVKAIAQALEKNSRITYIELVNNNMGSEGAKAIAQMLVNNSTIQYMDLSENNIYYDGIKELVAASKNNSTITKIDLRYNSIPVAAERVTALLALLKSGEKHCKNTKIDLRGNNLSPEEKETLTDIMGNKHTIIRFSE